MEVSAPKILILYASYGEGHVQAARAIMGSLRRLDAARYNFST